MSDVLVAGLAFTVASIAGSLTAWLTARRKRHGGPMTTEWSARHWRAPDPAERDPNIEVATGLIGWAAGRKNRVVVVHYQDNFAFVEMGDDEPVEDAVKRMWSEIWSGDNYDRVVVESLETWLVRQRK